MAWNERAAGAAITSLAMITSGCTTSLTSVGEPLIAGDAPSYGIPYRLPVGQSDLTVTWTIAKCVPPVAGATGAAAREGTVEYEVVATHEDKIVEGEARVIDYRNMTNHFKTGELKVEFHEGTQLVKSINAAIEGQEAKALGSALKLGLTVARIALGLPAPAAGGGAVGVAARTPCLDNIQSMITSLDTASATIKGIPAKAKALEDRMAVLRIRTAGGKLTKKDEEELEELQAKADALTSQLATLKSASEALKRTLSFSQSWKFPSEATQRNAVLKVDEAPFRRWAERTLRNTPAQALKAEDFAVSASLVPLLAEATCKVPPCTSLTAEPGFVLRMPVQALLKVTAPQSAKALISDTVSAPQFGRIRVLPLRSRWGEKNTLSATFAADGRPTMVEYKSLNAPGAEALTLANDAGTGVLGLMTAIDAKRTADRAAEAADAEAQRKAELAETTHQVALLEQQTKLTKLRSPVTPDVATLEADLAILRLAKEKSDLEAAIRKNQTP